MPSDSDKRQAIKPQQRLKWQMNILAAMSVGFYLTGPGRYCIIHVRRTSGKGFGGKVVPGVAFEGRSIGIVMRLAGGDPVVRLLVCGGQTLQSWAARGKSCQLLLCGNLTKGCRKKNLFIKRAPR